jgi:hypothetical protein
VIGKDATLAPPPFSPRWVSGYAKGVQAGLVARTKVTGKTSIFDTFTNVDNWVNVYGRLAASGGSVIATGLSYSAGYHKTTLLSSNQLAEVTISDPVVFGESRVVICADDRFNRYYGIAIRKGLITQQVSIVRGLSSISVQKFGTVNTTINAGDTFAVWYDRLNATVRAYRNEVQITSHVVDPFDIPHGPNQRKTGVVMGTNWLVDIGPNFSAFEAVDV